MPVTLTLVPALSKTNPSPRTHAAPEIDQESYEKHIASLVEIVTELCQDTVVAASKPPVPTHIQNARKYDADLKRNLVFMNSGVLL